MKITKSSSQRLSAAAIAIAIGATGTILSPVNAQTIPVISQEQETTISVDSSIINKGKTVETEGYGTQSTAVNSILANAGTTITINTGITGGSMNQYVNQELGDAQQAWLKKIAKYDADTGTLTYHVPESLTLYGPDFQVEDGESKDVAWSDVNDTHTDLLQSLSITISKDNEAVTIAPAIAEVNPPASSTNPVLVGLSGARVMDTERNQLFGTNPNIKQGDSARGTRTFAANAVPSSISPSWVTMSGRTMEAKPGFDTKAGKYALSYTSPVTTQGAPEGASRTVILNDYLTVTAAELNNEFNPDYVDTKMKQGETKTIPVTYAGKVPTPAQDPQFSLGDYSAPRGWVITIDAKGVLSVTSPDTTNDEEITIPVTATYPDGTVDKLDVKVTKDVAESDQNDPQWPATATVSPMNGAEIKINGSLPDGARVTTSGLPRGWLTGVDDDGTITVGIPTTAINGSKATMTITVTYADGSKDTSKVELTVDNPSMADKTDVSYNSGNERVPSKSTKTYSPTFNVKNPSVDRYSLSGNPLWLKIDANTGVITATPGALQTSGTVGTGTVRVTYTDGSFDTVPVSITVGDPMKNESVALYYPDSQSVRIGSNRTLDPIFEPSAPSGKVSYALENAPSWVNINDTTGVITLTPGSGTELKQHSFRVVATYDDGSQDTSNINVRVDDRFYNERIDYSYQQQSVTRGGTLNVNPSFTPSAPSGTTFTISNSPEWVKVNNNTGVVTISPTLQAAVGDTTYTVTAIYPDGSKDTATATVKISSMNTDSQVTYSTFQIKQGETKTVDPIISLDGDYTFAAGEGFPEWATLDTDTGSVIVKPGYTVSAGAKSLPIEVTFPDGSKGTSSVNFTLTRENQNSYLQPGYAPITVQAGKVEQSSAPNYVGGVPQGNVRYEVSGAPWATIDSAGVITVSPKAIEDTGNIDLTVKVTYSDGTVDDVKVPVTITAQDFADVYSPSYSTIRVAQGKQNTGEVAYAGDAPSNVTYNPIGSLPSWASLDEKTGTVTVKPTFETASGSQRLAIKVHYSDGTSETVFIPVDITAGADKDRLDLAYPSSEVKQSEKSTLEPQVVDTAAGGISANMDGVSFRLVGENPSWVSINPSTGVLTLSPAVDTKMGDYQANVEIIYKDGTREQSTAGFKVTGTTDATRYELSYPKGSVEQGQSINGNSPKRTTGANAPEGTRFDLDSGLSWVKMNRDGSYTANPDFDVKPGDYPALVTVTYPDGSSEQTTLTLNVTRAELSRKYDNPTYPSSSVVQGLEIVSAAPQSNGQSMPKGTTYKLRYGAPTWVSMNSNTGVITASPSYMVPSGKHDIPVAVVFPDGSQLPAIWSVEVQQGKMSDGLDPVYSEDITAEQGSQVTLPAPRINGQKVPEGTQFSGADTNPAWSSVGLDGTVSVSPGRDIEPGNYQVVVHIAYKDGTTDDVTVPVKVTPGKVADEGTEVTPPGEFKDYSKPHTPKWTTTSGGMSISDLPEGWTVDKDGTIRDDKGKVVEGAKVGQDGKIQTADGTGVIKGVNDKDAKTDGKSVNTGGETMRISLWDRIVEFFTG